MNRPSAILLVLASLGIGAVLGYSLHRPASPPSTGSSQHAGGQTSAPVKTVGERKVLYWYDPMRPNQHFDKPGKSPYMDMQLVPRYADEAGDGGAVEMNARAVQNLGIRTALVESGVLARSLRAVGNVAYDEDAVEVVQARVAGYVERSYVRAALDHVRRGQPLVDIVAPDWVAAQEEYLALMRAGSADSALRDAARSRLLTLGMPEDRVRAIERTGHTVRHTTLAAPIDGVVTELGARDGMAVMPGTPLFRINGLAKVWIIADVPEAQAAGARTGAAVRFTVPAWPGKAFAGRVMAVLPSVATATRTLQVRIEADNAARELSPGMYASLSFDAADGEPRLLVPSESVIRTGTRSVVIVAADSGFEPKEVRLGDESDGKTEVLHGLEQGERIVLSGQFLIDSEASLRATMTRLSHQHGQAKP